MLSRALLACICNNGTAPCHRCLVAKEDLSRLGLPADLERSTKLRSQAGHIAAVREARKEIFAGGFAVDSNTRVEVHLKPQSLVPTVASILV